ncbi:MAG: IS982 family transposase, partial [Chloroflexota bacterium]|nr:IS982 family transposase [Chloroflexota bacterium]
MIANFADFCLFVYVVVDDLWAGLPAWVKPRGPQSACSNSELLTMILVEECMGWDEETEAISQWHEHRDLFPQLPHRTRFNRRRRRLSDALTLLRQRLLALLDYAQNRQCVIDALPVPVLGFHLVPGAAGAAHWREHGADDGRISSKKQTIFGYKLHLLLTLGGVIRDFVLAPASTHDVAIAPELLASHTDLAVLGDKGYISAPLAAALREERGITLTTPLRRNQKPQRDPAVARLLNGVRQIIETVNDQLTDQFKVGKNHAHSFAGLRARLESKLTAHTLCIYINRVLGKAD